MKNKEFVLQSSENIDCKPSNFLLLVSTVVFKITPGEEFKKNNLLAEVVHHTVTWLLSILILFFSRFFFLRTHKSQMSQRPGAQNCPRWPAKFTSNPEARNYFPRPGIFKRNMQIFFIAWVFLRFLLKAKLIRPVAGQGSLPEMCFSFLKRFRILYPFIPNMIQINQRFCNNWHCKDLTQKNSKSVTLILRSCIGIGMVLHKILDKALSSRHKWIKSIEGFAKKLKL